MGVVIHERYLWQPPANESRPATGFDEAVAVITRTLGRPRCVLPADESVCDPFETAYWYRTGIDGDVLTLDNEGGGLYLFAARRSIGEQMAGHPASRGHSSDGWQIERSRNGKPDPRGLFAVQRALREALVFLRWRAVEVAS